MKKKIIVIGSLIAVVILVLASMTAVVSSDKAKHNIQSSPLFAVRIRNAINNSDIRINSQYIGKGREFYIPPLIHNNYNKPDSAFTFSVGTCNTCNCFTTDQDSRICSITSGPICSRITNGPFCHITDGFFCQLITEGPICRIITKDPTSSATFWDSEI